MREYAPILSTIEKAATEAMREAGREVLKRARELSPTLTGKSDKSGFVRMDDLTVQVGFTDLVSLIQHESLDNQHPQGGEPKFLEKAAAEVDIERVVYEKVRGQLG